MGESENTTPEKTGFFRRNSLKIPSGISSSLTSGFSNLGFEAKLANEELDDLLKGLYGDPLILDKRCVLQLKGMNSYSYLNDDEGFNCITQKKRALAKVVRTVAEIFEQYDPGYFTQEFDPIPELLIQVSNWDWGQDRESIDNLFFKLVEGLTTDRTVISAEQSVLIQANYADLLNCMKEVNEIDLNLQRTNLILRNGRMKIDKAKKALAGDAQIVLVQQRMEKLNLVEKTVDSLRTLMELSKSMKESIIMNDYGSAGLCACGVLQALNNPVYQKFRCVKDISNSVFKQIPVIRRKVDNALLRLCGRRFNTLDFESIAFTYVLLDYMSSVSSPSEEVHEHLKVSPLAFSDDNELLVDEFTGLEGLPHRCFRFLEAEIDVCLRNAVLEFVYASQHKKKLAAQELDMEGVYAQLDAGEMLDLTECGLRDLYGYLSTDMVAACFMRSCEYLMDVVHTHYCITQWHKSPFSKDNHDWLKLHESPVDHEGLDCLVYTIPGEGSEAGLSEDDDETEVEEDSKPREDILNDIWKKAGYGNQSGNGMSSEDSTSAPSEMSASVDVNDAVEPTGESEIARSIATALEGDDSEPRTDRVASQVSSSADLLEAEFEALRVAALEKVYGQMTFSEDMIVKLLRIVSSSDSVVSEIYSERLWEADDVKLSQRDATVASGVNSLKSLLETSKLGMQKSYGILVSSRKNIWNAVQIALVNMLNTIQFTSSLGLEDFLAITSSVDKMILLGKEFCNADCKDLHVLLQDKAKEYFAYVHQDNFQIFRLMVESEAWHNVSILLEEIGGIVGIVKLNIERIQTSLADKFVLKYSMDSQGSPSILTSFGEFGNPLSLIDKEESSASDLSSVRSKMKYWDEVFDDSPDRSLSSDGVVTKKKSKAKPTNYVITQSALNGIAKYCGAYLQLMACVPVIAVDVYNGLIQLFEFYIGSVFFGFVPQDERIKLLNKTVRQTSPPPDQARTFETLQDCMRRVFGTVLPIIVQTRKLVRTESAVTDSGAISEKDTPPLVTVETVKMSNLLKVPAVITQVVECVDFDENTRNMFALFETIVASESCYFVSEILGTIIPYVNHFLPKSYHSTSTFFASEFQLVVGQLTSLLYREICPAMINRSFILSQIGEVNWDSKNLQSDSHSWVEGLVFNCERIWNFLCMEDGTEAVKAIVKEQIWMEVCTTAFEVLLEGFCKVKKCSKEGRALMAIDLSALHSGLDAVHSNRTPKGKAYVEALTVKVSYMSDEETLEWIKENYQQYAYRYVVGVITSKMSSIMNPKKLKDAMALVDNLFSMYELGKEENKLSAMMSLGAASLNVSLDGIANALKDKGDRSQTTDQNQPPSPTRTDLSSTASAASASISNTLNMFGSMYKRASIKKNAPNANGAS